MTALYNLVGWILAGFYALVPNYAVAIILLGITFMALVVPFTLKSTRSMLAMQKLQPKVKQLQEQHRNNKLAFNQAVTDLYKDLMASAAQHPGPGATIHAFGIDLAESAWTAITKNLGLAEIFGSLFLLLVMIAANYYQQVQITNLNPMARQSQQANSQLKFMRLFPIIFGVISIRFASALVLYYAVSALFRVGQQWAMYRFDPKVKALVAEDIGVVEARFSEIEHQPAKALAETRRNGTRGGPGRLPERPPAAVAGRGQAPAPSTSGRPPAKRPGGHNRKRKRR